MTTLKNLLNRFQAFDRDEQGAAGSIETVAAVAVGVLILAAVLKIMGNGQDQGLLATVKNNMTSLIGSVTNSGNQGGMGTAAGGAAGGTP